ncbi:MAG: NADH-quinone oxidoreductase subunit J [Candidatus Sumerlaeia bacterium]|nr:NADH-quinone oxidoreductase subunit J [Candidatus Sumerlaeia bacterium]
MGAQYLIYGILYVIAVLGALTVLLCRDTVKSALALVLVMLTLAAHYFVMGQEFVGAIQIIVYAGAIMVLFLFVIMLLNMREREVMPWYLRHWRYTAVLLALLFFTLVAIGVGAFGSVELAQARPRPAPTNEDIFGLLMTKYLVPFLLTSVLLLVAVIGAVVMGRRADPETGEEYLLDQEETA